MARLPSSSSSLELTISMPGFTSSQILASSEGCAVRDLDINQVPSVGASLEEEWLALNMEDDDDEESIHGGPPRKKLRLTKEQSHLLEESFRQNHTLSPVNLIYHSLFIYLSRLQSPPRPEPISSLKQKEGLAMQLKLRPRQVEVWFQNRRARRKLRQTEMECEYLKRWFVSLTEQNRRLQREVEELRALKVGPPTVITPHMSSKPLLASTLTVCPCCERVTTTSAPTLSTKVVLVPPLQPR
ncbi:homeobox-leucine zipper protein HOX3-like isoform X2 [Carya illinoinensis]|uniref:Homeobox domain-containing protein n=1 Tax=Carya illinoinensis TaxID=32201 RepID=A0A8T1Q6U6_CARIL|nr:homeobox-leucine zipper protein HOX3-like isoform X2 [Carya illinoinensis]KAG6649982.1 hypothetical protein CIPAW_06G011500 [Carya illinoinensis]